MAYREAAKLSGGFSSRSSSLERTIDSQSSWSNRQIHDRNPAELFGDGGDTVLVSCSGAVSRAASEDLAKGLARLRLELDPEAHMLLASKARFSLIPKEALL